MNKAMIPFIAGALLAISPGAFADSKAYDAKSFSRIEVDGAMSVVYKSAPQTSVRVETNGSDFSDARISNKGDTLIVSRESLRKKRSWFSWGGRSVSVSDDGQVIKVNGKKVPAYTVYVTGPDLASVTAAQSSRFEAKTLDVGDISASASSSGDIVLAGKAGEASLSASSSGDIDAMGLAAGALDVSASSSGDIDALTTGTATSTINTSSAGQVNLDSSGTASFVIDASSGSSVDLAGRCSTFTATASSGASVDADDLQCVSATASASSGGSVDAYATGAATGNASSGGSISFSGKPAEQAVSESSGGSVSFTG